MYYTVYKVTNKINGKFYVGAHKTKDLDDGYMGSGVSLRKAQEEQGIDNFKKEILYYLNTEEEMFEKEAEIVDIDFVLREDTYNLVCGGSGGFTLINNRGLNLYKDSNGNVINGTSGHGLENLQPFSVTAEKMKEDGRWEAWKENLSRISKEYFKHNPGTFTGKKHTQETKDRIGAANSMHQRGANNSQHGTMWITNGVSNKKILKEDAIPEGWARGRVINPEVRKRREQEKVGRQELRKRREQEKVAVLRELHEIYIVSGFGAVKETGYKFSQPNLVNQFMKYLPEFKPQNGKIRNSSGVRKVRASADN